MIRVWVASLGLLLAILTMPSHVAGQGLVGSGKWHSTNAGGVKGGWKAQLEQSGGALRGTLEIDGSNVFRGGAVEGVVSDGQVVLGVFQEGQKLASFAGKLTGDAVSGEWEAPLVADEGTWEGTLTEERR